MTTSIAEFIDRAWDEHVNDSAGVAARFVDAMPLLEREPSHTAAFVGTVEHVLLAHLGDADAMQPWLARLAPLAEQQADARPAIERARLAARLLRGEGDPADAPAALRVRAHGTAANGCVVRGEAARARELLMSGQAVAREAGDAESLKAFAASCNNLARELLDRPADAPRTAAFDALMMEAATLSRSTWAEAGTWMNLERAEYLLALCAALLGDTAQALGHARSCLAICEANDADAFERFFAHQALGEAARSGGDAAAARDALAAMRRLLADIADDGNRAYAQSVLDKLARPGTGVAAA
jgi:hypothetical protein